jgi:hypothetical protein
LSKFPKSTRIRQDLISSSPGFAMSVPSEVMPEQPMGQTDMQSTDKTLEWDLDSESEIPQGPPFGSLPTCFTTNP